MISRNFFKLFIRADKRKRRFIRCGGGIEKPHENNILSDRLYAAPWYHKLAVSYNMRKNTAVPGNNKRFDVSGAFVYLHIAYHADGNGRNSRYTDKRR